MEDPVGEMVVADEGKDLGLVNITGIGKGIEYAIGIKAERLAITVVFIYFG